MLTTFAAEPEDVRPVRAATPKAPKTPSTRAGFGEIIAAARNAMPDGRIREIRMPDGNGTVQVRMWRPGDFRSLGNNVVYISRSRAQVLTVDRYSERSGSNRFLQAMAGLHYDEWGGITFRVLAAVAGLLTPVLFVTGILIWWFARRRKAVVPAQRAVAETAAA
jgi:uncharacterized iron-regulated membrane protein